MSGFLGTNASLMADLSLLLVFVFGAVGAYGGWQAREHRFSRHCPIMATAALLNWLPVLLLMVPAWLGNVSGGLAGRSIPELIPVFHGVLGGFTQLLMTYTVVRMYWVETLPPQRPIWLMRVTIVLWMLSLVGGIVVYIRLYLPLV